MVFPKRFLFDIGTNLTDNAFSADRESVVEAALQAGIKKMLVIGTDLSESHQAIALCETYPEQLIATAGCHPHYAKSIEVHALKEALISLLKHSCVRAIGECGLDFNRNFSPQAQQIRIFEAQLEIAKTTNYPVYLHERDASDTMLSLFTPYVEALPPSVLHCFTGNQSVLKKYLDLGLYIGITGWICDERRGQELQSIVKYIPKDRILIETDAPYLLPRTIRPKPKSRRNEPSFLPYILQKLSQCMEISEDELAQHCYNNARDVFSF
ncbi:MAG: TatD family hydrolase [Pseudomonadota bacterium]